MSKRTDITVAEIGPNTDAKLAAVAVARDAVKAASLALGAAMKDRAEWETRTVSKGNGAASLKVARRNVEKTAVRHRAAVALFDLALADVAGRVHILRELPSDTAPDAAERPVATRTGEKMPETATETVVAIEAPRINPEPIPGHSVYCTADACTLVCPKVMTGGFVRVYGPDGETALSFAP